MTQDKKQTICDNIYEYITKKLCNWMDDELFIKSSIAELGELYYNHVLNNVEKSDEQLLKSVIRTIKPKNINCKTQEDYYIALCKILHINKLPSEVLVDVQKEYDEIFVQKYNIVMQKYHTEIEKINIELNQNKSHINLIKSAKHKHSLMQDISTEEKKLYELYSKCNRLRTRKYRIFIRS